MTGVQTCALPIFSRSISFPSINLNIHIKLLNEPLSICVQQEKNPNIKCFIDPPNSGLFKKVGGGGGEMMHPREEAEGQSLKNPFDTITEALGINRLTQNFMMS